MMITRILFVSRSHETKAVDHRLDENTSIVYIGWWEEEARVGHEVETARTDRNETSEFVLGVARRDRSVEELGRWWIEPKLG